MLKMEKMSSTKKDVGTSVFPYGNMGVFSPEGWWFHLLQLDNIPRPDQEKHLESRMRLQSVMS